MTITIMTISIIMIMCFAGRRIALGGRGVEMDESGSGWDGGGADCMGCLCMGIPYVGIPSIGIPSMGSPLPGDPLRLYIFIVLFKRPTPPRSAGHSEQKGTLPGKDAFPTTEEAV